MNKLKMTREERILKARRKGWEYLKEYFGIDFKAYCRFLDRLHDGSPKPAVWMQI